MLCGLIIANIVIIKLKRQASFENVVIVLKKMCLKLLFC